MYIFAFINPQWVQRDYNPRPTVQGGIIKDRNVNLTRFRLYSQILLETLWNVAISKSLNMGKRDGGL